MTEATQPLSPLAQVRALMPPRPLTPGEARVVIERQAARLITLAQIAGPPVPVEPLIHLIPRVTVQRTPGLPTSGRTEWAGTGWLIQVDPDEAPVRQRFSLAHELAHVVFHTASDESLPGFGDITTEARLESACEYFAACLLMPRLWMKRAYYGASMQDVASLSRLFNVSQVALRVRLEQLGLVHPTGRDTARSAA